MKRRRHPRRMKTVCVLAAASLLLAGCMGASGSAALAGQGEKSGTDEKTAQCGSSADVSVALQGEGRVKLTVKDGAGTTVYTREVSVSGQEADHQSLQGAKGLWTLTATFSGRSAFTSGFQGQWALSLTC